MKCTFMPTGCRAWSKYLKVLISFWIVKIFNFSCWWDILYGEGFSSQIVHSHAWVKHRAGQCFPHREEIKPSSVNIKGSSECFGAIGMPDCRISWCHSGVEIKLQTSYCPLSAVALLHVWQSHQVSVCRMPWCRTLDRGAAGDLLESQGEENILSIWCNTLILDCFTHIFFWQIFYLAACILYCPIILFCGKNK